VTDLHYASPDTNFGDDGKDLGPLDAVRDSVFVSVDGVLQAFPRGAFDLVAVCGDITTRGREEGLTRSSRWAKRRLLRDRGARRLRRTGSGRPHRQGLRGGDRWTVPRDPQAKPPVKRVATKTVEPRSKTR
jgi:hypothetical protein